MPLEHGSSVSVNINSGTTDKVRADLISEEEWKLYYRNMLVNDEETSKSGGNNM
jgi:hypothetical protein